MKLRIISMILMLSIALSMFSFGVDNPNGQDANHVVLDAKYDDSLDSLIREKISFPFDERLFTLYTFMNYTGYDDENAEKYHPVRQQLRNELKRKSIDIKEPNYYQNRTVKTMKNGILVEEPLLYSSYISFLHMTGIQYPSFSMSTMKGTDQIPYSNITDLGEQLYMFYQKADIEGMLPQYKRYHDYYISQVKENVYKSIFKIATEFNLKEIKEVDIDINLLEAYHRGLSYLSKDVYTGKSSIHVGPTDDNEKSAQTIVHEYMHQYVNPVVDQYDVSLIDLDGELIYPVEGIYSDKRSIIIESIVRVLDTLYTYDLESEGYAKEVDRLELKGFVFANETYTELLNFNFESGTLADFLHKLMNDYTGSGTPSEKKVEMAFGNHPIEKMHFVEDIKVFTLLTFLNLTGFDETGDYEMGLVRKQIRETLAEKSIKNVDFNYYAEKGLPVEAYLKALGKIDFEQEFMATDALSESLSDLPEQLKNFCEQVDVQELYDSYKTVYQNVSDEYLNMSKLKLLLYDHNDYYDISYQEMKSVNVIVELQGIYDEGFIYNTDETMNIVIGDSDFENGIRNIGTLYRKYILTLLDPIVNEMWINDEFDGTLPTAPKDTLASIKHGDNSVAYITENLMYAIRASMIYRNFESAFPYEYEERKTDGYMLVEPMCQRVQELHSTVSFNDLVQVIMKEAVEGKLGQ